MLEEYFNQRDYERFGIDILRSNGFEVEVFDCTAFLASEEYKATIPPGREEVSGHYRLFPDTEEATGQIAGLDSSCFVVSFVHLNLKSLPLYRALKKRGITYGVFLSALLDDPSLSYRKINFFRRVRKLLRQPWRLIDFAMKKWIDKALPLWPFSIEPAAIAFAQSERYLMPNGFPATPMSEILFVHSFDYDIYLKEKYTGVATKGDSGVFLDEYIPFHTDYHYTGDRPQVGAEEYYPKLCSFFDYLESTFGVTIRIAAHPRSQYENMNRDFFGGRPVVRGKTVEMVKNADFVILHNSMAINYAVLFKKPLIFITSEGVKRSLVDPPSVERLAAYFNKKAINLDQPVWDFDFKEALVIDESRYDAYRNNYIKKDGSEEAPFWQIVADRIKKGF